MVNVPVDLIFRGYGIRARQEGDRAFVADIFDRRGNFRCSTMGGFLSRHSAIEEAKTIISAFR
jgi:hypothetical protein